MNNESKQFTFWELINNYKIEIPIIQRDYAQGRDSAKNIRTEFVETLYNAFNGKPIVLDSVYGYLDIDKFIPIDGQQRLTTLFLLHWYLVCKDKTASLKLSDVTDILRKFSYKVRDTSRDFCNELVGFNFTDWNDGNISEIIKNQSWFFLHWKKDPTVDSMLNMLDAIEKVFDKCEGYFDKLIHENILSFVFLDFKSEFKQGDLLYVRMNARGKHLTDFELFKSNLQTRSKSLGMEKFAEKIDVSWTDYFWRYRNDNAEIDDIYLAFLKATINNSYFLRIDKDIVKTYKTDAFDISEQSEEFSKRLTLEVLNDVERYFDNLIKNNVELPRELSEKKSMEYKDMLMWHATCLSNNADWLRVIGQLVENRNFNTFSEYQLALIVIENLKEHCDDILAYIRDVDKKFIADGKSAFDSSMLEEVLLKAKLSIIPKWDTMIRNIENEAEYFRGQIGFLFNLADIDLSTEVKSANIDLFQDYYAKVHKIWGENGLTDDAKCNELFRRAMLSTGDYVGKYNSNCTFYTDTQHRDLSWRNYLSKNDITIKVLLDSISTMTIFEDMQMIIDDYVRSDKEEWQKWFVKYPELFNLMGNDTQMIRWENDNSIHILSKKRMSSVNYEYYSYSLFLELCEEGVLGLDYSNYSGEGNKYLYAKGKNDLLITYGRSNVDEEYAWLVWNENRENIYKVFTTREDIKKYLIDNSEKN